MKILQINRALRQDLPLKHHLANLHQMIQESIKLNPNHADPYFRLAESYYIKLIKLQDIKQTSKLLNAGIVSLDRSISINPNKANFYWLKMQFLQLANSKKLSFDISKLNYPRASK